MGSPRQARILLRACLGHVLLNAAVQTQGEVWLALAKCDVAEFSLAASGTAAAVTTVVPSLNVVILDLFPYMSVHATCRNPAPSFLP